MTNNFIAVDWEHKTQGVWMQDFPLKSASRSCSCAFEDDLVDYYSKLRTFDADAQQKVSALTKRLRSYDFTSAEVDLVASVPGVYTLADKHRYGIGTLKLRGCFSSSPHAVRSSSDASTLGRNAPP
jgi:tyrosyl-DNA phosphodiesterase-1